jgi:hypothetical protein
MRHVPRPGVILITVARMVDFTQRLGVITMLNEILRHRHGIRRRLAEVCRQVVDAEGGGPQSGHQIVAGRRADRLVAVSHLKEHAALRQAVHVRRLDLCLTVTPEQRLEVVHTDEQDVGLGGAATAAVNPATRQATVGMLASFFIINRFTLL